MAGHPLRIGDPRSSRQNDISKKQAGDSDDLSSLRRFLMRLALDTHTPSVVLERATRAISKALGAPCTFVEGNEIKRRSPGRIVAPVTADNTTIGALVIADKLLDNGRMTFDDLQELADLVGICLLNASQAQAVAELQNDSEDMLFYAPDAIFVLTMDGIVEMANQRALSFVDRDVDAVHGRRLVDIFGTVLETPLLLQETAKSGGVLEMETHCRAGTRLAALTLSFIGEESTERILCVVRDITAERQAALALRKTERTTLMGQAISYLMHEVNNPLAALLSNLSLIRKRSKALEPLLLQKDSHGHSESPASGVDTDDRSLSQLNTALRNAETSATRIKETMSMLRSAHKGETWTDLEVLDPRYELTLAVAAAEEETAGRVRFTKELEVNRRIRAPSLSLAEAMGALLKNALQALEGADDGRIWIWARESSDRLIITVADNGTGVDDQIRNKIFMPFFTTKPLGEALGLGLTLAEDTIRRLGGTLNLVGGSNRGAVFEITIPLVSDED